jgi:transcriptional regulator with AAA-type ATPase domain
MLGLRVSGTVTSRSLGRGGAEDESVAPVHQLVVVLDCDRPMLSPSRHRLDGLDEVRFGRGERGFCRDGVVLTLRHADVRMSTDHGRLVRGADGWLLDDPYSKNGCIVNGRPSRRHVLADGDLLELGHTMCLFRIARPASGPPDLDADALAVPARELATFSGLLEQQWSRLAKIAATEVPVVVLGETGTGKEIVARALHKLSGRSGSFVAVNSGALPETLLEAELFGTRKGAFSGALTDRVGLVRSADAGTLFLDEIAELRAHSQVALLRVLQEREVVAIGDARPIKVDVRFCAATHRDLDAMVERGEFRRDLHARLNGLTIALPPLRARREDLGMLVRALLSPIAGTEDTRFAPAAARMLFRHDWPGNVRELEKALASAVALAGDRAIEPGDLPIAIGRTAPAAARTPPASEDELRAQVVALLREHAGNIAAVARAMNKEPVQIRRWIRRFGLDLDTFRT